MTALVTWVDSISVGQQGMHGNSITTPITVTGHTDGTGWSNIGLTQQSLQNQQLTLLFTGYPGNTGTGQATVSVTYQVPMGVVSVVVQAAKNSTYKNLLG